MSNERLKNMEKRVYITEEERAKCQKVADAFAELYEIEKYCGNGLIESLYSLKKQPLNLAWA